MSRTLAGSWVTHASSLGFSTVRLSPGRHFLEKPEQNSSAPPPSNIFGHSPLNRACWLGERFSAHLAQNIRASPSPAELVGRHELPRVTHWVWGEKAGLEEPDSKMQGLCKAQKPERVPSSHREELFLSSWRRPLAPLGYRRAHAGGLHWRRSTRAPQVYHGAVGLQTSSSFLSTSVCDTGWEARGSPPPPPPPHSCSSSRQVRAGCRRCCSCSSAFPSSPKTPEKPPEIQKVLTKPLHHCMAEQTPGRACP